MVHQIPLSIVIVSFLVPLVLARRPRPDRSVRMLYLTIALAALVWCALCLNVYPAYVLPE